MPDAYVFVEENKNAIMRILAEIDILAQRREEQLKKKFSRQNRGVAYRYRSPENLKMMDVAMLPTLRSAAMRGSIKEGRVHVQKDDIKEKVRRIRKLNLVTLLLDASSSVDKVIARKAIESVNRAVLMNTYQKRDRISIIECRGQRAQLAQRFTASITHAESLVKNADFRGLSPLASGLMAAVILFRRESMLVPDAIPTLIVISDGEVNVPYRPAMDITRELHLLMELLEEEGFFTLFIDVNEKGSQLLKELSRNKNVFYYHAMQHNPRRRFFMPVLGEEATKEALVLSKINPKIRGILLYGSDEIVHANRLRELAGVLPDIEAVSECPYHCDPEDDENLCTSCRRKKEELPPRKKLSTSRIPVPIVQLHADADLEEMAGSGVPGGLPGVFGMANRGILFVEDIHRFPVEKKEILIEAMDTGRIWFRNLEENEIVIPANFVIVGTVTGFVKSFEPIDRRLFDFFDIRIELRDARKVDDKSIEERIETIKQGMAFESDPLQYRQKLFSDVDVEAIIDLGRKILPGVEIARPELTLIGRLNVDFGNAGYEAELSMARIARSLAAFEGKKRVEVDHIRRAAEMSYRFREKTSEEPVARLADIELLKSLVKKHAKE